MKSEYYLLIGAAVVVVVILLYLALTANFRKKRKLFARVLSRYGVPSDREYTEEELLKIRKYYDLVHEKDRFAVDDITWNDLGMDEIFIALNHTFSSLGEEELYRILRESSFDETELSKRAELIEWFREHEMERNELLVEYAGIGRTKKYTLIEHLESLKGLKLKDNIGYLLHLFLLIIAIVAAFIKPVVGIIAIIVVLIYNFATYIKEKQTIEPYYLALSAMAYIVKSGERIARLNIPAIREYNAELTKALEPLKGLVSASKFLGASNAAQLSANPFYLLLDYLRMTTHLDFISFNKMVKTVNNRENEIKTVLRILGFIEAMIAVGSYRETLPFYTEGEFTEGAKTLTIKDAYHPLIKEPVANSVKADSCMLVTGSNASGKSTFLRTVAVSVILSESVVTVPAHALETGFFRVFSSMALQDSLASGKSYYIVEIESIKRIMDETEGEIPVLAFVDEVLRGTNTVERIAASSQILKSLTEKNALVFAATHDVELTYLLENLYHNIHFEEEVEGDNITFNYLLKEGRATTRNAIKLLKAMGYEKEVTEKAEASAVHFTEKGDWQLM